jgi:hypothetical protein
LGVSDWRQGKQHRDAAERGGEAKIHSDCLLISPRIAGPDIGPRVRFRGENAEI